MSLFALVLSTLAQAEPLYTTTIGATTFVAYAGNDVFAASVGEDILLEVAPKAHIALLLEIGIAVFPIDGTPHFAGQGNMGVVWHPNRFGVAAMIDHASTPLVFCDSPWDKNPRPCPGYVAPALRGTFDITRAVTVHVDGGYSLFERSPFLGAGLTWNALQQ